MDLMKDVFVSKLTEPITSWTKAFPNSTLVSVVSESTEIKPSNKKKVEAIIFWLHLNKDNQQYIESVITTIKSNHKDAKIVVLANIPNRLESIQVLKLGAMGYCHAYIAPTVLKEIKFVISHGGLWVGQDILQGLIETSTKLVMNTPDRVNELLKKLTKREAEVALEVAKGLSNKEIARVLGITERTVKAHLASTFERLMTKDRLQLALTLNNNFKGTLVDDKQRV